MFVLKSQFTLRNFNRAESWVRCNHACEVPWFTFTYKIISSQLSSRRESVPEPDEIGHLIGEVINLARQISLEVDSDEVEELLDSHNQELTMDELIEMYEQEQHIKHMKFLESVQQKLTQWRDIP
ncbi:hypothetical protein TNCV_4480061 [Trichonephila clavipes]|nr:hypothetical protein TNCV_4480061 [Trichonephila clavipes]